MNAVVNARFISCS